LGVDGDFYIDTDADAIFGPKAAGAWGSGTSLVGPTGETGAAGATGDAGATGSAGADGKTVRNGTGAPSGALGVDGDFYIDTDADAIYGPKTAGAWGSATSLVGPAGTAGQGVPIGGTIGQILAKNSGTDYDTEWIDPSGVASASETVQGIAELATQAETDTGTDDARIVTPLKLQTRLAAFAQPLDSDLTALAALSTTSYGRAFLELANQAALMALLSATSESAQGVIELATQSETDTGTDNARAVTPLKLQTKAVTINAQTGTTYTFVLTDQNKWVSFNNASAVTVTVPPNSSVAFPVGTQIEGAQLGAGQVTFAQGSGVTIRNVPGLKIAAQYGVYGLMKIATDEWVLYGRLVA
jgi:hypothetical protein